MNERVPRPSPMKSRLRAEKKEEKVKAQEMGPSLVSSIPHKLVKVCRELLGPSVSREKENEWIELRWDTRMESYSLDITPGYFHLTWVDLEQSVSSYEGGFGEELEEQTIRWLRTMEGLEPEEPEQHLSP